MKPTLLPGLHHTHRFTVTDGKTVPALYPESEAFRAMPPVFATGFLVGLIEWTCIEAVLPHLDAGEQTVGTHIDVSHTAATPVGLAVTVEVDCIAVEGRKLVFTITARDDRETVSTGRHERFVIDRAKFMARVEDKGRAGATA